MKFNKIVALALALVMVFALCACGGGNTNKKDDSGSTAKVDTSTVSVGAVVIARDDVPTDQIYAFVSTIFNNLDAIAAQHGKGAELNLEAAASVKGVPYHPGAAKYFEEKGLKVDAVKDGAGTGTAAALSFGTGGDTGTYYGFGSVLANYVSTNSDCKVTALTSGGSQANVEDLTNGNVQIAFVQSDVMNYAYNGQRLFESPVTGFSVVAQLYQEQVQIVTTNPDIKTVADLAGKKVVFHVKAKEIKCKELPKLDDDFAKDVSEYDTLKELKDSIKREITEQREQSAKYAVENELMEKVAANIECDIPDALIDEQCARFLEEFKQRLQSQGIPYDQYCKMTNMDEAKFLEEGKEPATRQVRMDLAVNAIIKEEKLEATDEEVEKQYNDLAEKYSMDVGELKKYLDAMSVRTQIIRDKAISVVVDSAKIEKKKAPKKEAEGEAAEGEEKPAKKTAAKKSAKKEEEKAE